MFALSKVALARSVRRIALAFVAALVAILLAGCQDGTKQLNRSTTSRQFDGSDGFLYEPYDRDISPQFVDLPIDGVMGMSFIAYLSVPLDRRIDFQFEDVQPGGGWTSMRFVLSNFTVDKSLAAQRLAVLRDPEMQPDTGGLLQLSLERATLLPDGTISDVEPGRGLQIVDYASLMNDTDQVAFTGSNPDNPATD